DCVYVNHQLFWCAGNKGKVRENVYKDAILFKISQMEYPLVIKDTTGLSSYGMEVCRTFEEAKAFLCSKRNNSDRVVEHLIEGRQLGAEVYCCDGKMTFFSPLEFSVNKYGITSPKLSIKKGPVNRKDFCLEALEACLKKIAEAFKFNGVFQVDLVFAEGKWYVIEINPRLSGMSWTYSAALGKSPVELLLENALGLLDVRDMEYTINFKLPLQEISILEDIYREEGVRFVHQVENLAARQEREKGYLEVVLCGKSLEFIENKYKLLKERFDKAVEDESL
uniref:ATP-grasp domain-containing protein n=1 Tax=Treponema sp. TaxID=166 RepID=UPI0025EA099E